MAVFKCKMCGGALEITAGDSVAVCEYCNTRQTLPRLDDEKRANLYDRANHFRRGNEFDKAMGIYEMILSEEKTDSEAYWGIVLCRFGIEYVEDPRTHRRIPTVNRAQLTSIFDDVDYKAALQHADMYQRNVYIAEARAIDAIQKGILSISQKEEPFDIFICYKETDSSGNRTQDSVYAEDIYTALTKEGYKVFFSRITLEDKLGSAYEPYIFAALNSAKVMLVVGTNKDNFNAVWVKNEWSRYLSLIKQGKEKTLIPVYKDISPYDMPEEFQYLQSQDMGKIGFMQDLIRGIKKIIQLNQLAIVKEPAVADNGANVQSLLKRVFMFLKDKDWRNAKVYCEKVLDIDPENAQAYLGKLLVDLRADSINGLSTCIKTFSDNPNYQKVIQFGDANLKTLLKGYNDGIIYKQAVDKMRASNDEKSYKESAKLFASINWFKNSAELANQCYAYAEQTRKDAIIAEAKKHMSGERIQNYKYAINCLNSIRGWRNADQLVNECVEKINTIQDMLDKKKRKAKRRKRITVICFFIMILIVILGIVAIFINNNIKTEEKYNNAIELLNAQNVDEAYVIFQELGDYKDSKDKAGDIRMTRVKPSLEDVDVGDCVLFGSYEQDNNTENGSEDVEWLVLEKEGNKILVVSKYALVRRSYSMYGQSVKWENSSIRKWLNDEFVFDVFSPEEQSMISTVTVPADLNPDFMTNPGEDTQDKVFLLSVYEVEKYFNSDSDRVCEATAYAKSQIISTDSSGGICWLLRSPGGSQDSVASVAGSGAINTSGVASFNLYSTVRPAMWIDISDIE